MASCQCILGYTGNNGDTCLPCSAGQYKDVNGSAPCTDCRANTYSVHTAAISNTTCLPCPPNSQSEPGAPCCLCDPGYTGDLNVTTVSSRRLLSINDTNDSNHSNSSGPTCEPCPAGQFKSSIGNQVCVDCDSGKYSAQSGSEQCLNCVAYASSERGATFCMCNAGATGDHDGCTLCGAGKYKNETGPAACLECPVNTFNPDTGSTSSTQCQHCPRHSVNSESG